MAQVTKINDTVANDASHIKTNFFCDLGNSMTCEVA